MTPARISACAPLSAFFLTALAWTFSPGVPALEAHDVGDAANLATQTDAERLAEDIQACYDHAVKLTRLNGRERDLARIKMTNMHASDPRYRGRQDLIDALCQLLIDQEILEKAEKAFQAGMPEVFLLNARHSRVGDENYVIRAVNSLRTGSVPRKDIETMSRKVIETISRKTNDLRKN
jgi:hypothetical protein